MEVVQIVWVVVACLVVAGFAIWYKRSKKNDL